jgi:hypothetical protein
VEKVAPLIWAAPVILEKLTQVTNCPIGKKSPNLVTLLPTVKS